MNKLISSALLTVVAVPFLMAAPATKKAQTPATTTPATATTVKKTAKKHVKKAKTVVAPKAAAVVNK